MSHTSAWVRNWLSRSKPSQIWNDDVEEMPLKGAMVLHLDESKSGSPCAYIATQPSGVSSSLIVSGRPKLESLTPMSALCQESAS